MNTVDRMLSSDQDVVNDDSVVMTVQLCLTGKLGLKSEIVITHELIN